LLCAGWRVRETHVQNGKVYERADKEFSPTVHQLEF
jgi:hypothetical protein